MKIRIAAILLVAALLPACGTEETVLVSPAAPTVEGTVVPAAGSAFGAAVYLRVVDDNGVVVQTRDVGFADGSGAFRVHNVVPVTADARLLLEAVVGTTSYFRFLTGATAQAIGPATTGVSDVVRDIVGSTGDRSIFHYTHAELEIMYAAAAADLAAAGADLSDPDAVRAIVLADTGGLIADLSEGTFAPVTLTNPVAADPPDVVAASTTFLTLMDGGGQRWDIQSSGYMSDGTSDAYDGMFFLSVGGVGFPSQASATTQDARELVLGPSVLAGLNVTRKIYVDDAAAAVSFTRYLEILSNPTAGPITVTVLISGNLGSDEGHNLISNSSSGDTAAGAPDFWVTTHQQAGDPALGFLFPGATQVVKTGDNLSYSFQNVVVPAGATVTILHWAFQNTGAQPTAVQEIDALLLPIPDADTLPDAFFKGLSKAEVANGLVSFAGPGVAGGAGSVAPQATVTTLNTATGESVVRVAASDGSFRAIFAQLGAASGDLITVTATDGTNTSFSFP
jgi:hypothetical protein